MRTLAVACLLLLVAPSALANFPGWGQVGDKNIEVDLIRFAPTAEKAINALLNKAPDGTASFKVGDKRLPAPFDALKQVTLVTTQGVKKVNLTAIRLESGAGEGHLLLTTPVPKGLKKGESVLFPDQTKPFAGGPLRASKAERPKAKVLGKLLKQLIPRARKVARKGDPPMTGLANAKASALSIVRGNFGKHAAMVALKITPENALTHVVSALFLVDKNFNVTAWVEEPRSRLEAWTLHHVVDLDKDGVDELIADSYYYEGTYTGVIKVLKKPRPGASKGSVNHVEWTTLSGDGA